MKAIPSLSASEVLTERTTVVRLPVSVWEEETFAAPVYEGRVRRSKLGLVDWENIEAVGAADDAARFKINFQTIDPDAVYP